MIRHRRRRRPVPLPHFLEVINELPVQVHGLRAVLGGVGVRAVDLPVPGVVTAVGDQRFVAAAAVVADAAGNGRVVVRCGGGVVGGE